MTQTGKAYFMATLMLIAFFAAVVYAITDGALTPVKEYREEQDAMIHELGGL